MNFVFLRNNYMKKIITNIAEIIQVEKNPRKWISAKDMNNIDTMKNSFIEITNEKITNLGNMSNFSNSLNLDNTEIIDAKGGTVFPTYCDSHTHLVFAENRETEFVDRINNLSYEEIAKKGGGILNSVKRLKNTSEDDLFKNSLKKIKEVIKTGTGAIEIKSGYGLTVKDELKILRVIKQLKENTDITIKSTFLGAHAVPDNFKNNKKDYINLIVNEMLPMIADEELADYIDVFCEKEYFSVEDTIHLLKSAEKYGIKGKVHVNQFNSIGGIKACVDLGAMSVDHLEVMKEDDFNSLINSTCMPTILPSCSFFLGIPYSPARKIIDRGIPIALASDYNPGSSPSSNMNFVSSLGCIKLKMSPEEVINATTINAAYAMGIEKELGSIAIGKQANLFITEPISSYSYLAYCFGRNIIDKVFIKGNIQ